MKKRALVLGAGLQGITSAFALHDAGYAVRILDRQPVPFNRASLRNEGKIHLGLVYANDPSFQTARLMLESALAFGPLLDGWAGRPLDWAALRSRPFRYAILPDTLVPPAQLLAHYERLQAAYEALRTPDLHYVGGRPERLYTPPRPLPGYLRASAVEALVDTAEVALHLPRFREVLLALLAGRGIAFAGHRTVREVARTSAGFRVEGTCPAGTPWAEEADLVVNCLWEGRLAVDATLGLTPPGAWVYRLKHRILGQLPPALRGMASYTFVLGAYGDVVTYPQGGQTYLSWYPACMQGWSEAVRPPAGWEAACNGEAGTPTDWVPEALAALNRFFPGMDQSAVEHVDAGIIYSKGKTDITDLGSELHERYRIGVRAEDGYFSIDTGKFTSAPLFARHLQTLV
jgi:glycine/D-amino acid oxidase-like deaminating enzyme